MIFIYDVLLNLNERFYDFYDWKKTDEFAFVKKIPLFKVSNQVYNNFLLKNVKVSKEFLNCIKDKTLVILNKKNKLLEYASLLTNGEDVVAVTFDSFGFITKRSKMLINEELEVLEVTSSLKVYKLFCTFLHKTSVNNLTTRDEEETINKIEKVLLDSKFNNNLINYLYYEWFNKMYNKNAYEELLNNIRSNYSKKHEDFLKLINKIVIK